MDGYLLLHHLLLFVCLLVLPRLPAPQASVDTNIEDVEDLVLTRVGYIPAKGLYVCFTRPGGTAPDLGLQYTVTYTHGHPSTHSSCSGDLLYRGAELGSPGFFCLPPCPSVEGDHLLRPVSLVLTGHDRTTKEATAALVESLTFSDVAATVVQVGHGVLEVQWTARPGSTFRVELWHTAKDESRLDDGEAETSRSKSGQTEKETLMKIKQCYHETDYYDDDDNDDDDDDDDNDDDDHEEDSDDYLKWKRWRRCVALHAPSAPVPLAAAAPSLVHTSQPITCLTDACLYYITDGPASGNCSVVVMDVTHSLIHASHSVPAPLLEWTVLPVESVIITSTSEKTIQQPKTMTITVHDLSSGISETSRSGTAAEGSVAAVAQEADSMEGDLQVVVINGHSHTQAVKSLSGDCNSTQVLGAERVLCTVKNLEALEDLEGLGPTSSLLVLLTSHKSAASALVAITDVHARVKQVGPGTVLVLWDRDAAVQEFTVTVTQEAQSSTNSVNVACDKRGTDCLVMFRDLPAGEYIAEVRYDRAAQVQLKVPFITQEENKLKV